MSSKMSNDDVYYILIFTLMIICLVKIRKRKFIFSFFIMILKIKSLYYFNSYQHENRLKLCNKVHFFTYESIKICDYITNNEHWKNNIYKSILLLHYRKSHTYLSIILLLSGDISLNPGPQFYQNNNIWSCFKSRGIHLLHLNINSLLPKIDEVRDFIKKSNASVLGLTETKLDDSISNQEIDIQGYILIRSDRNRHGGGVACYIKNNLCFQKNNFFTDEIENLFFDILLPKSKPFTVGIFYRPPNQNQFIEKINEDFHHLNCENKEVYILGDLNINLFVNGKYTFEKNNNFLVGTEALQSLCRQYKEFCSFFSLTQLIKSPTRITCSSSTLLDHILTNTPDKVKQAGIIDISISDHQLIYCTRKIWREKINKHKYVKQRNFRNFDSANFLSQLQLIDFPNYERFLDTDSAYNDFLEKLMKVVDISAPLKEKRIKCRSQDWFDGEIADQIDLRYTLFKKFKQTQLQIDEVNYKNLKYQVRKLIKDKKRKFIEQKLNENVGKPKDLWKTIKSLGLPSKVSPSMNICLKNEKGNLIFDPKENANIFKIFFSNLANELLSKLPSSSSTFSNILTSTQTQNSN